MNKCFIYAWALILSAAFANKVVAQDSAADTVMQQHEKILVKYADSMMNGPLPSTRSAYVQKFIAALKVALEEKHSYKYPFDDLAKKIHIIKAEDDAFRIFNWVFVASQFQRRYFGAIQMNDSTLKLYPLFDKSEEMEESGTALDVHNNKSWYGGEIYNITVAKADDMTIYNVFSYNNNAYYSKKKILDILTFTDKGVQFGMPIIHTDNGTVINRMIMEYKKEAYANLNYNKDYNKIIFDRLASDAGDPSKRYTYVPTGVMDGFVWRDNGWYFVEKAIPILRLKNGQAPIDGVIPGQ